MLNSLSKNQQIVQLKQPINGLLFLFLHCLMRLPSQSIRHTLLRILGMNIHKSSVIYMFCELRSPWTIEIGSNTTIGHSCVLDGRGDLSIGNSVNLSSDVMIWTAEHDVQSSSFAPTIAKVCIEDYAWLCCRSIILPGVTIGRGSVVAAGAVVTKSVEPYTIVAGIPAKPIGTRSKDLDYSLGISSSIWFV